ncbi:hypothetical protein [Streptomyces noursei]|uniref:hypothetical protein n=1 Tax=Streptomyces noursei TaxID=1971 RepID=UPI00045EF07E|nr:hypothetical protein [Streptomyces noursei]AIA08610.1 hypothetical protein DC74_p00028 [Streptomyces noursei]
MTTPETTAPDATGGEAPDSPGIRESLRALRPSRQLGVEVYDGSLGLLRQGAAWLFKDKAVGGRLGGVAVGAYALVWEAGHHPQYVMPAIAVGWTVAAVTVGHRDHSPTPPAKRRPRVSLTKSTPGPAADEDQEHEDQDEDEVTLDEVVLVIRDIAAANGHQGAHLEDIAAELTWTKAELRDALDEWGVPVAEFKLRFGGRQRVRVGVRLRDLPGGVGEAPPPPPRAPGRGPAGARRAPAGAAGEGLPDPAAPRSPNPMPAPSQGAR